MRGGYGLMCLFGVVGRKRGGLLASSYLDFVCQMIKGR